MNGCSGASSSNNNYSKENVDPQNASNEKFIAGIKTLQAFDENAIRKCKAAIIAGYLNLGEADGWTEGHDNRIGASFTRNMLIKHYIDHENALGDNKQIFEKVIRAFLKVGAVTSVAVTASIQVMPTKNRACYDPSVMGWKGHAVTRVIGNLGSVYDVTKPFFEILINSARTSIDNPICQPFFISVFKNGEELEKRRKLLASFTLLPASLATDSYYAKYLKKPGDFLKENQSHLGPNSTRILKGLQFLENTQVNAQKVGNCWIKQPIRCALASMFLEISSANLALTPEQAWTEAKGLYKQMQKTTAIPTVKKFIGSVPTTSQMRTTAAREIERMKKL